jgi:hypothetical protein
MKKKAQPATKTVIADDSGPRGAMHASQAGFPGIFVIAAQCGAAGSSIALLFHCQGE